MTVGTLKPIKYMLSVVLATHNEEKNLKKCLDAVADIAGEIIIADGESTDATLAIAQEFNATIIPTTNKLNFHINKQLAMDAAKGSLVLQLDADEVVDQALKAFISKLLEKDRDGSLPVQPVAWYIKRRNFFLGAFLKKGGQYPDSVIRLYKNGKAQLPQKNVHEQMTVDGETAVADGHLLHYAFPDFKTYMRKFNTYTSFEAQRLHELGFTRTFQTTFSYWCVKPIYTFVSIFLRHRGYVDGFPGFTFSLMSALHHPFTYLKLSEYEYKKGEL